MNKLFCALVGTRKLTIFYLLLVFTSPLSANAQSFGLQLLDQERYASIPLSPWRYSGPLPSKADLSRDFPQPGNQGHQGSCVGWALGYALKSFQENVEFRSQGRSADFHFSPAFVYNQLGASGNCQKGISIADGLSLLETQGILPLSEFPYTETKCSQQPSSYQKQVANEWGIARWYRVNVQSEMEIKSHISSGFPVVIAIGVDRGFERLAGSAYTRTDGQFDGYHALVVVGFDDSRQAFRVFNSWGTTWGDGGMAWISYSVFKNIVREGYAVLDVVHDRRHSLPSPAPVKCETWGTPYRVTGVDHTDVLNMRSEPNPYAQIVTKIPFDGSGISLRRCEGGWCEVQFKCSTGWVNKRFLTSGSIASGLYRVVNVSANDVLYVRPAPRKLTEFLAKIPPNATGVRVIECLSDSSWCKIEYSNVTGWVNYKFLSAVN